MTGEGRGVAEGDGRRGRGGREGGGQTRLRRRRLRRSTWLSKSERLRNSSNDLYSSSSFPRKKDRDLSLVFTTGILGSDRTEGLRSKRPEGRLRPHWGSPPRLPFASPGPLVSTLGKL